MATSVQQDIMRLVIRGSLELLLHENADMIDLFVEANRHDLTATRYCQQLLYCTLSVDFSKIEMKVQFGG